MPKLTVAEIKRQISALEAKALRLAEEESKASVAKVRALMDSLGVTIEHLTATVSKRVSAANKAIVGKKTATAKRAGAGVVRYRDPETGATWTGFGRAPAWIVSAEDREIFAVGKATGRAAAKKKATEPKQKTAPRKAAAPKKAARPATKAKTAAKNGVAAVKRVGKKAKSVAEASAVKKAAARKTTPRKVAVKKVAAPAPEAAESNQAS